VNKYEWKALFTQPSTWAGFSVLSAVFGAHIAPDIVVQAATAVSALFAIFVPEKGAK
jgi:hypothetical protein